MAICIQPDFPNRHFVDTITAMAWELHALNISDEVVLDQASSLSPWSLYEIALKTGFQIWNLHPVPAWEEILSASDACRACRSHVKDRIATRAPITRDLYQLEEPCLIRWKREMRTPRPDRQAWPPFCHTVAIVKPSLPYGKEILIADSLARFKRIVTGIRTLTSQDVFFIYSTAFGESFTSELISYHTSGPSELILLSGQKIVDNQTREKHRIREAVGILDERRNLIHFPDSLGETYATIAHFFGQNVTSELVIQHYATRQDDKLYE